MLKERLPVPVRRLSNDGAEMLDDVYEEGFGEAVGAYESHAMSLAGTVEVDVLVEAFDTADKGRVGDGFGSEVEFFDRGVDGFFSHLAICRPFPAGDGEETRRGGCSEMIADETF